MIEIAVVVALTRYLLSLVKARGAHGGWAALGPILWVGGEFMGFIIAGAFGLGGMGGYPLALLLAGLGAGLARWIASEAPLSASQETP